MSGRSKKRNSGREGNDKKKARRNPSVEFVVPPMLNLPPPLDNANDITEVNDEYLRHIKWNFEHMLIH